MTSAHSTTPHGGTSSTSSRNSSTGRSSGTARASLRGRSRLAASAGAVVVAGGLCLAFAGNAMASPPSSAGAGAAAAFANARPQLSTKVAPGGNFNLSLWSLQLPIGSAGDPTIIQPAQLEGSSGFQDSYFYTNTSDGGMEFWDPENGVTTANSSYPRSELREMDSSGQDANWFPKGTTNTLDASLKVLQVPDHVCVGQIHLGSGGSTKPLLELFYYANGDIKMAIEQTPAGGNEKQYSVGQVPIGTKWSYKIGLTNTTISLVVNSGSTKTWQMSSTFNGYGMYFKAGDYDQSVGSSSSVGAKVEFYSLSFAHS
jgi:hypothetical protein